MKTQKNKGLNFIRLLIAGLIILSVAGFASAQKRTKRKTPVKQQFQSVTVEGATFKIPANWEKIVFLENLWKSRDGIDLKISINAMTAVELAQTGGFSIEQDLKMFYETQKNGGTEGVRI